MDGATPEFLMGLPMDAPGDFVPTYWYPVRLGGWKRFVRIGAPVLATRTWGRDGRRWFRVHVYDRDRGAWVETRGASTLAEADASGTRQWVVMMAAPSPASAA